MNIKKPKSYQEEVINELKLKADLLLKKDERTLVFQSPTGSGKTFMMSQFISQFIEEHPNQDLCFLWVSIGKGDLHIQSQESLKNEFQGSPECNLLEEEFFGSRKTINKNEVVVVNWEKLRTKNKGTDEWKNILMKDKETTNFRELAQNTREENRKIIMIVDESHSSRDTKRSVEIIDDIIDPDLILEMSATPVKRDAGEKVNVKPTDVINQGMIKKEVIINSGLEELNNQKLNNQELIMETAFNKRLELKKKFEEQGKGINPLAIIQLPNSEVGEEKKAFVENFLAEKGITTRNGKLAVWLNEDKVNHEKEVVCPNDSEVEFLIFKQAIDTGWDCPRAHILIRFREIKSITFEIQTVGRILRMPEAEHYSEEDLNRGFVYLNASDFTIKPEDYNPNIIKSAVSKRKDIYKPLKLESYYKNRLDYGDITSGFYNVLEEIFCNEFNIQKGKTAKKKISDKIDLGMGSAEDKILLNKNIDMKKFGSLIDEKISSEDFSARLSHEDALNVFENLIKKNLGPFAPKRSIPTVKQAIYLWFKKYLGVKVLGEGLVYVQNICLNNLEFFDRLINMAIEEYRPAKDEEVKKKMEELEIFDKEWEIPEVKNFNPNVYRNYDFNLSLHTPCYLKIDSGIEKDFIRFLEGMKDQIIWWWQNGDEHMRTNFGIKYNYTGKPSTFQPDFLILFRGGFLGIFDTKAIGDREDKNKIKSEALKDYIDRQRKRGKKIVGGIVVYKDGKFRLNSKKEYSSIMEKPSDWDFFDSLFHNKMFSKDPKRESYKE